MLFPLIGNTTSLIDVYEDALVNDPLLKEALANKEAISEFRPQARSLLLPQINATGSYSDSDVNGKSTFQQQTAIGTVTNTTGFLQESETTQWEVSIRQTIFDFGAWMTLKKANKTVAQSEIDYLAAEQALMVRVATAYFNVLAAQDTLESEQAARQAIEKQLDQSRKRFDVGLIAITDVQEAQAAYDQSIANEIIAKRNLATSKESLRAITDNYPSNLLKPDNNLPLIMPNPQSETEWVNTSLEQNLNFLSAQLGTEIARSEVKVQRSGHFPTIGVQAQKREMVSDSFRSDSGGDFNPADTENINEGVGVQVTVPIFSGGQTSSRVRQAVAQHRATKEKLERVRLS